MVEKVIACTVYIQYRHVTDRQTTPHDGKDRAMRSVARAKTKLTSVHVGHKIESLAPDYKLRFRTSLTSYLKWKIKSSVVAV